LNIFSAPDCEEPEAAEPDEPEAAAPDEPDAEEPLELGEAALGALLEPAAELLPADLSLLDALSPAACASDVAKAAAIAAAIRVLSFMQILLQGKGVLRITVSNKRAGSMRPLLRALTPIKRRD
jgi:hypothetical protein